MENDRGVTEKVSNLADRLSHLLFLAVLLVGGETRGLFALVSQNRPKRARAKRRIIISARRFP